MSDETKVILLNNFAFPDFFEEMIFSIIFTFWENSVHVSPSKLTKFRHFLTIFQVVFEESKDVRGSCQENFIY